MFFTIIANQSYLLNLLIVFIVVIFFIFTDRKIMAVVQRREGPNKIFFFGILQSLADA